MNCVVCGQKLNKGHKCPQSIINGKESANKRFSYDETFLCYETPRISQQQKLFDGLQWMKQSF